MTEEGGTYSAYSEEDISIEGATGDLIIKTDVPFSKSVYIAATTTSGVTGYLPISISVICGQ